MYIMTENIFRKTKSRLRMGVDAKTTLYIKDNIFGGILRCPLI